MILTVIVRDAYEDTYEQALAGLTAAGIEEWECHLQTDEQHQEHPIHTVAIDDEAIRGYLTRNPAAFRELVHRDMRIDHDWWQGQLRRMERIEGHS